MRKSSRSERSELIRQWLAQEGSLKVGDLVSRLGIASMTVRRDLAAMEEQGVLMRTHGGCTVQSPMVRDLTFSEKDALHGRQKAAIAREAARLIEPGQSIFIDTGTTALHFARALPETHRLQVFTNNLRVAMDLFSRPGFEVNVFGGRLASNSPDLVGDVALTRAGEYQLDVAVLGTDAIDPVRGETYAADIPTANLDRMVQRQSSRVMILGDSSKFGKRSLVLVARLQHGMTLITDDGAPPRDVAALRKMGAEIVTVPVASELVRGNGRN